MAWFGPFIAVSFKYFGYYLTVVPAGAIRAPQGRRPSLLAADLAADRIGEWLDIAAAGATELARRRKECGRGQTPHSALRRSEGSAGYITVTVPDMPTPPGPPWMTQWYGKVPGAVKVRENWGKGGPPLLTPESQMPVSEVIE